MKAVSHRQMPGSVYRVLRSFSIRRGASGSAVSLSHYNSTKISRKIVGRLTDPTSPQLPSQRYESANLSWQKISKRNLPISSRPYDLYDPFTNIFSLLKSFSLTRPILWSFQTLLIQNLYVIAFFKISLNS